MKRVLVLVLALLVLGALVFWTSRTGGLPEPWGTIVGQNLSHGGNFAFEVLAVGFLLFGPLSQCETRRFRFSWTLGAGALYALVVESLKRLVFWPRPIDVGQSALSASHGSGFPSGHTVPAFLVAVLVGELEPKLRVPALGMAVLIGYSRVEVTAHFASQVWLSALIGVGLGLGWCQVRRRLLGAR
jgi:membrane-associated phospholipid phosphatase